METDPLFAHSCVSLSLEEERRLATKRILKVFHDDSEEEKISDPRKIGTTIMALGQYDWSLALKLGLLQGFFINLIRGQGTGKHWEYIEGAQELKVT